MLRRGSSGPAARADDVDTSTEAAASLRLTRLHQVVLDIHAAHPAGLADFELAAIARGRAGWCHWKRTAELIGRGYLTDTGERRWNPMTDRRQAVLRITEAGHAWLAARGQGE